MTNPDEDAVLIHEERGGPFKSISMRITQDKQFPDSPSFATIKWLSVFSHNDFSQVMPDVEKYFSTTYGAEVEFSSVDKWQPPLSAEEQEKGQQRREEPLRNCYEIVISEIPRDKAEDAAADLIRMMHKKTLMGQEVAKLAFEKLDVPVKKRTLTNPNMVTPAQAKTAEARTDASPTTKRGYFR